ncbi:kinase-like protein [Rhizoclosmatium globosum]|uniref:dual-specificity kinase n=1 Tax=Rhizoclosmatium globosum TaxID=329046 RepID=A0A1Y2CPW1_9FUNG|nr:kinase-like protein [Rhizoclosmatium globosum]|eukprot:ORY49078.1 kinase-like protein [Rhizoclosmatium globosum]
MENKDTTASEAQLVRNRSRNRQSRASNGSLGAAAAAQTATTLQQQQQQQQRRLSIAKAQRDSKHGSQVFMSGQPPQRTSMIVNTDVKMQRSSTVAAAPVRRSMALNPAAIAAAKEAAAGGANSAGITQTPQQSQQQQQQQLAHRLSLHSRSLTTSNSNQLPTPAPNHFYQQQQQMLNPNYRQLQSQQGPQSPTSPTSPPQQLADTAPPQQPLPTPPPPVQQPQPSLRLPLSPEITVQYYRDLLSPYELHEVFQYPHIYFAGAMGVDKIGTPRRRSGAVGVPQENLTKEDLTQIFNQGYDDSRGDYYWTAHDHIGYRYECISLLGKGSFGQCLKCFDHKTKTIVAVKIIRNKKRFEKQGVVEVKVLDRLRREDSDMSHHLVHMQDSFYFRGHLVITFELLGINLYEWVKSGGFRGIHMGVLKSFTVQILKCLQLLHNIKAIHCDLKPENILLCDPSFAQPQKCDLIPSSSTGLPRSFIDPEFNQHSPLYDIKVIDFGSACFEHEKVYTYIQSRFYRSPEVILGSSYNTAIDMWSVGCIIAELLTGYPLFPGENEQHQLACIMEVKGVPPEYIIERGSRRKLFFEHNQPRSFTDSRGKKRKPGTKNLSHILRTTDVMFLDFLERCLEWDPERRMKPDEAMRHEWLVGFAPATTPPPVLTPVPMSSTSAASATERAKSPSTSTNSKYSFGEMMSNAASSIVNRGRAYSNAQAPSPATAEASRLKKTASIAITDNTFLKQAKDNTAAGENGGEPSTWKASFSSWRRMGSISGASSKRTSEVNLKKPAELAPIPAATAPSMARNTQSILKPSTPSAPIAVTAPAAEASAPEPPRKSHSIDESAPTALTSPSQLQQLLTIPQQLSPVSGQEVTSKTPVENVVIDVLSARTTTPSAVSTKSVDKDALYVAPSGTVPSMSRGSSFSAKLGGIVRSLSQKKKK